MRELRLKYFIDLVSNIQAKAKSDAEALTQSQSKIQAALSKTNTGLGAYERVLLRAGNMQNAGLQRQAQYFATIAQAALRAQQAVARYTEVAGKIKNGVQGAAVVGGAVAAAGYVAARAIEKPVDYDTRLRKATTTAFAGKDIEGLRAGYQELGELIKTTVRSVSGATRDETLGAYEALVGSGNFTKDESAQLLPSVMKTSVASGADSSSLVQAAEKLKMGELKLKTEEIPLALSKIMRAGQEGGFEITNSAKFIGQLVPLMKGYKGMAGVEALVTMLQQVRATAGSNDQAANNLQNFLQKIPAQETRQEFAKQGIDLDKEMVNGALKGLTPVDVYMAALNKAMAKQDPEGKAAAAMRQADKSATPEQRSEQYDRIAEVYRSAAISTIIKDIQEFGGYSALAATQAYGKKTLGAVQSEDGSAVTTAYQFMTEGSGAKITDVNNRKDIAASDALDGSSGALNKAMDGVVALADKFPGVASSAYGATVALGALTAAAGAAALLSLGGGAGKTGWLAGAAGKVAGLLGAKAAAAGGVTAAGAAAPAAATAAAAAGSMGAAALGGTVAAGLALVGAPILGTGVVLSNRANSQGGLRARIADREERVGELDQLIAAGGTQQTLNKLAAEKAALLRDRDAMQLRLPAAAAPKIPAETPGMSAVPDPGLGLPSTAPKTTSPTPVALATTKPSAFPVAISPAAPVALPAMPPATALTEPVAAKPAQVEVTASAVQESRRGRGFIDPRLTTNPSPLAPPINLQPDFARDVMMRAMPPLPKPSTAALKPAFSGLDFLTLTAPGAPAQNLQPGGKTEIKVGEGVLNVRVTVQDDRVRVEPVVSQQPSLIKISAGATNPGGFR